MIDADINGLNRLYLLKVRELARTDLYEAQILSGLGNDVLQQLAQAPLVLLQAVLDETPVLLFRARFDRSFWRSLGEGLSTARKESLQQFAVQATLLASVDDKDKPQ